jgi:hypothetical protein
MPKVFFLLPISHPALLEAIVKDAKVLIMKIMYAFTVGNLRITLEHEKKKF